MYLGVFVVILLASTIAGGVIPDNTFLFLTGAVAAANGFPFGWFLVVAICGGFAGYEINYWSGRLFGLTICRGRCKSVLDDRNVRYALDLMNRFGPLSLVLSRFLPVLNMPSFIAGADAMSYRKYVLFNFFSSIVWCSTLMAMGYFVGSISLVGEYLDYITDFFLVITAIAIIIAVVLFVRDYLSAPRGN
jgi:membrane-associated protein